MYVDEYWNKFVECGTIESYLSYVDNKKTQDKQDYDEFISDDNRRPCNQGAGYR